MSIPTVENAQVGRWTRKQTDRIRVARLQRPERCFMCIQFVLGTTYTACCGTAPGSGDPADLVGHAARPLLHGVARVILGVPAGAIPEPSCWLLQAVQGEGTRRPLPATMIWPAGHPRRARRGFHCLHQGRQPNVGATSRLQGVALLTAIPHALYAPRPTLVILSKPDPGRRLAPRRREPGRCRWPSRLVRCATVAFFRCAASRVGPETRHGPMVVATIRV